MRMVGLLIAAAILLAACDEISLGQADGQYNRGAVHNGGAVHNRDDVRFGWSPGGLPGHN